LKCQYNEAIAKVFVKEARNQLLESPQPRLAQSQFICFLAKSFITLKDAKKDNSMLNSSNITILLQNNYGGPDTSGIAIIDNTREFQKIWLSLETSIPLPLIDFSKQVVAFVFMGAKPSGGYGYEIAGYQANPDGTSQIEILAYSPGINDMVSMALTSPYMVLVAKKRQHNPIVIIKQK
jgi:hypothetical protein